MSKIVTTRLPDEIVVKIKEIAKKEQIDNSTVVRRLLAEAIKEWHKKEVLRQLNEHEISIGQAAKLLNLDLWDMINIAKEYGIDWTGFNDSDFERMKKILKSK